MRGWKALEVVDTIYEDDQEEEEEYGFNPGLSFTPSTTSTLTLPDSSSPYLLPLPTSLQSVVKAWSQSTGSEPDVVVRVHDECFHLHRALLLRRSGYLRRRLKDYSDVIVSPPAGVTVEAFAACACACYGGYVRLTPLNVAAIRAAAEWLEIKEEEDDGDSDGEGSGGNGGILWRTEAYFFQEVAGDAVNAAAAFRSCAAILGGAAAGAVAPIAAACVEALAAAGGEDGGGWLDELAALPAEQFRKIAEAMQSRLLHDPDLLYRVVDHYLQNHSGKLTEEEKTRLCNTVDCTKLSPHLLMHLVQNPRLPLRFVLQAMLVDNLHPRRSVLHPAAAAANSLKPPRSSRRDDQDGELTLGDILHRDAALRQTAHLRASMEATSFRLEGLQRDLATLHQKLRWSEEKRAEMESARSSSFRIIRPHEEAAADIRSRAIASSKNSCDGNSSSKKGRRFGQKLMHGLKNMFRKSGSGSRESGSGSREEKSCPGHRRNRSLA